MIELLNSAPTCESLAIADYVGGMAASSGITQALENSGIFPARYLNALSDALFYCELRNYILYDSILQQWMWFVVNNLSRVIMSMSTAFVTMWVIMAGLKLMYRTNKEPALDMMFRGAKIVLVLSLMTGMLGNTDTIIHTVLAMQGAITRIVTGSDLGIDRLIDMNIAISQVMNMVVEDITNATVQQENKTGSMSIFAGLLGQSGPAILTSVMVLLAQIAIVFSLMLAPLFIFFLLFKETTSLFWSWAKFLLGTFVSLCFLAIISTIAMTATLNYGLTIMVSFVLNAVADAGEATNATAVQIGLGVIATALISILTGGGDRVEMSGAAMRLAMMGGLFATLIVAVPPLIMQLFNASIGYASNLMGSMGLFRPMQAPGMAGGGGQQVGYGGGASGSNPSAFPILEKWSGGQVGGGQAVRDANAAGSGGGSGGMGVFSPQTAVNKANMAALGNDAASPPALQMAGQRGIAATGSSLESVHTIQQRQESAEFRNSTTSDRVDVAQFNADLGIEDAQIRREAPHLGTGGLLNVQGGVRGDSSGSVSLASAAASPQPQTVAANRPLGGGSADRPGVPKSRHMSDTSSA